MSPISWFQLRARTHASTVSPPASKISAAETIPTSVSVAAEL